MHHTPASPLPLVRRPLVHPVFYRSQRPSKIFVDAEGKGYWQPEAWEPACELLDRKTTYLFRMELPGIAKASLSVKYANGWLVVAGNKPYDERTEFTELTYGAFTRMIPLPSDCDTTTIKASFTDGILSVVLQKRPAGWVVVDVN